MKVLFLDIDGVLNSEQSAVYYGRLNVENGGLNDFSCPIAKSNLHSILEEFPDLRIVVSSTWRLGETLATMQGKLASYAMVKPKRVIGMTPNLRKEGGGSVPRGLEIQTWLDEYHIINVLGLGEPAVEKFVIVDDDSDMAHLMDHFVKTHWRHGLMRKDAIDIIDRFYLPWKTSSGWELGKLKESEGLDHLIVHHYEKSKISYWGKSSTQPVLPVTGDIAPTLEDWALGKVVETEDAPRFHTHKTFVKANIGGTE